TDELTPLGRQRGRSTLQQKLSRDRKRAARSARRGAEGARRTEVAASAVRTVARRRRRQSCNLYRRRRRDYQKDSGRRQATPGVTPGESQARGQRRAAALFRLLLQFNRVEQVAAVVEGVEAE